MEFRRGPEFSRWRSSVESHRQAQWRGPTGVSQLALFQLKGVILARGELLTSF